MIAEAAYGIDAVTMVESVGPDMVIMDIQMSAMSSIEATRKILLENPTSRVVLTSMTAESEYLHLVREIGALAFIAKRNLNASSLRSILSKGPSNEPLHGSAHPVHCHPEERSDVRVSAGRDCVSGNFNAMVVRLVDDSTTSQPANALTSVAEPPSSG